MIKTKPVLCTAAILALFGILAAAAEAQFEDVTSPKGTGIGNNLLFTFGTSAEVECLTSSFKFTIEKTDIFQGEEHSGGHWTLKITLFGSPRRGSKNGPCDLRAGATTLEAEIPPIEWQLRQPTKGVNSGLTAKVSNDYKIVVLGGACELFMPSKSNQELGKASIENVGSNLSLKPEFTGITSEAKGAGCALAGIKNGTNGGMLLSKGGKLVGEGVKAI
jgi:hypothetical protein